MCPMARSAPSWPECPQRHFGATLRRGTSKCHSNGATRKYHVRHPSWPVPIGLCHLELCHLKTHLRLFTPKTDHPKDKTMAAIFTAPWSSPSYGVYLFARPVNGTYLAIQPQTTYPQDAAFFTATLVLARCSPRGVCNFTTLMRRNG